MTLNQDTTSNSRSATLKPVASPTRWELIGLAVAVLIALGLGFANLGGPSLWHDELVHAFVAKSIVDTGEAQLPSGVPYRNGALYHLILAAVINVWDFSEVPLRFPSVVFAGLNVLLTWVLTRKLLGRETALIAALALAVCPWTVDWSREARFYSFQQTLYLVTLLSFWNLTTAVRSRSIALWATTATVAYACAIITSFHSALFLGALGVFVAGMALVQCREAPQRMQALVRSRWFVLTVLVGVAGILTLLILPELMNPLDREAVFQRGGLGGGLTEEVRPDRLYYTMWLQRNLSRGFFVLALFGFVAMLAKEQRRGVYAALAFWVPILALTFLIGYRRPRFMFFAFPLYVVAVSYGTVAVSRWLRRPKNHWIAWATAVLLVVFALRLAWSGVLLVGDSLETVGGSPQTLARVHPQWREACEFVRDHRSDEVVIATTYLPVLYYLGGVDDIYPYFSWEEQELGRKGLETLDELKGYVAEHPSGFFIEHWWRFRRNEKDLAEEVAWVSEHMTKVYETPSIADIPNDDITVWRWGATAP